MSRLLNGFLNFGGTDACKAFPSHQSLFEGLAREEAAAIRCLSSRISGTVLKIGRNARLVDDDIEELLCDCITLLIEKIRAGEYLYRGFAPTTYAVEIAKKRALGFRRKALRNTTETLADPPGHTSEEGLSFGTFEATDLLEKLLQQVGDNCRRLIRLKYFEELRDREVVEQGLTQYNTVNALKNHRARCLKKLTALAAAQNE